MAPSTRGARVSKRQTPFLAFSKVSKAARTHQTAKVCAYEEVLNPLVEVPESRQNVAKRKLPTVESDSETESPSQTSSLVKSKKAKLSAILPSASENGRVELVDIELSNPLQFAGLSLESKSKETNPLHKTIPALLSDLKCLHKYFLKAFTIHVAHNGKSVPADLGSLLATTTRLWKKRKVTQGEIQKMLALYEFDPSYTVTSRSVSCKKAPFKLYLTGYGGNDRRTVEFTNSGKPDQAFFDEERWQKLYEQQVDNAFAAESAVPGSWPCGDVSVLPEMQFEIGIQTQGRKDKASMARNQILGISSASQSSQRTSSSPKTARDDSNEETGSQALKARTLSLFDRVRAKQLASSSINGPTSESILRSRAIGRIDEVVDILRMKQQQKLGSTFASSTYSGPGKVRGKVSFGLNQVVHDIKSSLAVAIGTDEIRMCVKLLAEEVTGNWVTMFKMGSVETVILDGSGLSGIEVKRTLSREGQQ